MKGKLLAWLDETAHRLDHLGLMPGRLVDWLCDRYDRYLDEGGTW